MTLLHLLRKQLKWKDKEADESEKRVSLERLARSGPDADLDSDGPTPPETQSKRPGSADTIDPASKKMTRMAQNDDSASATVIKTLVHVAATSNEGYERDRAILSITGGNNIVDALKILVDPAFLSGQAAYTNEIYDITDSNGRNVAHYAVSMGNLGCVEFLTSAAPDLFTRKDSAHRTPAYIAAALGQSECLRLIARFAPDSLCVTDSNGVSPAHASALQGEFECIRILVESAPHLFYNTEASGKTPAHIAVFADMADVVEMIAKSVPDSFKVSDADRLTPAHIAIMYGKKECLKAITRYAPDSMQVPSGRGITAEQMLASNSQAEGRAKDEPNSARETAVEGRGSVDAEQQGPEEELQTEEAQTIDIADGIKEVTSEGEVYETEDAQENEIAMLKRLLKTSLQLETFLADLRHRTELHDFEQDSLGVAFRLRDGSVLAMTNNGVIFSAIYSDSKLSTTILVEALTGGVGRVVEG